MSNKRFFGITIISITAIISWFFIQKNTIADTAPNTPTALHSGTTLWQEDFETLPYGTPPPLASDSGTDTYGNGISYNTDAHWRSSGTPATSFCNGYIVGSNTAIDMAASADTCNQIIGKDALGTQRSAWWFAQNLSTALGIAQEQPDPTSNHAVIATTSSDSATANNNPMPNNGNTQLRTSNLLVSAGHYYRASAWFAAANCTADTDIGADALSTIGIYATSYGSPVEVTATTPTSPCQDGQLHTVSPTGTAFYTSRYATNIIQISREQSYSSTTIEIRNAQLSTSGNDSAFDLPTMHDVTPEFSQAFSPLTTTPGTAGATSTLIYTITNTAELAAKPNLSFSNTLPYGITPEAESSSDCSTSTITVSGQQVNFIGSLAAGQASCTISINVSANSPGTFTNDTWSFSDSANTGHYKPWGLQDPAAATLIVPTTSKLDLSISTNIDTADAAAQNIIYSFTLTNLGNDTLNGVQLDYTGEWKNDGETPGFSGDAASISEITCSETPFLGLEYYTMVPGATVHCYFTYKITQTDIDRQGGVDIRAVARGNTNYAGSVTVSAAAQKYIAAGAAPSLELSKIATRPDTTTPLQAGEIIDYYFIITNKSDSSVRNIIINDLLFDGSDPLSTPSCPKTTLTPYEIMTCSASYTITTADAATGTITNAARAEGIGTHIDTEIPVTSNEATAKLPAAPTASITLTKTHTPLPTANTTAGSRIEYIYIIVNTGNTPLDDITISDDVQPTPLTSTDCPTWPHLGTINPGELLTCKASYTITQADIDHLAIHSTAKATATSSTTGTEVSATNDDYAYPVTTPDLTLTRITPPEITTPGNITYSYSILNNGNVTLTNIDLRTSSTTGSGTTSKITCDWQNTPGTLAPEETAACSATYTVTAADITTNAPIIDTAAVTGTDPAGKIASSIATITTPISRGTTGTITGHLFMDHNMNQHFDTATEPAIAGVLIWLNGTDTYGNTITKSFATNEAGEYFFTDLYPGTYDVSRTQNSYNHISVGSTGGYYQVNRDGNPLPSPKNGTGSAQDDQISRNLIQDITLDAGDYNQGNDFGESCGSIGNFVWHDTNGNGRADPNEPGIAEVELALYIDTNDDGIEDDFIGTTFTDQNGTYYFSTLDLNHRDDYLVRVTDGNGVLASMGLQPSYTATKADFLLNDCSSNSEDGSAYAGKIELADITDVTWFDWITPDTSPDDLQPASPSSSPHRTKHRLLHHPPQRSRIIPHHPHSPHHPNRRHRIPSPQKTPLIPLSRPNRNITLQSSWTTSLFSYSNARFKCYPYHVDEYPPIIYGANSASSARDKT